MFYSPIVEMWDRFMKLVFPHLKYRDAASLPSRDRISRRVVGGFQMMWGISFLLGGLFGSFIKSGGISIRVGICVTVGLVLLAIGIFLVGKSIKPVSGDYWQKWWRGEIQWWKILRF